MDQYSPNEVVDRFSIRVSTLLLSSGAECCCFMILCFAFVIEQVRQIHKRIRVVRLVTTNDSPQRIVGLLIPNSAVESVLTGLFLMS